MGKQLRTLLVVWSLLAVFDVGTAKYITGRIQTASMWRFVTRFVFMDYGGRLQYEVDYPLTSHCCPNLVFYYDDYWLEVYPKPEMSCKSKMEYAVETFGLNLVLALDQGQAGHCMTWLQNNATRRRCTGDIQFRSVRARWWYLVFSQCNDDLATDLDVKYNLTVTNGDSWEKHLSADDMHMLETYAVFLLLLVICYAVGLVYARELWVVHLLHRTYKIYLLSLTLEVGAVLFDTVYYTQYVIHGEAETWLQTNARLLHAGSEVVFMSLLLLVAKGFTITRGRLSSDTQVKLAVFISLYAVTFGILFIIQTQLFDPGLVRYIYDSPAGTGIVSLRVVGWTWFCYAILRTVIHYPEKKIFFSWFCVLYSVWFLAKPTLVLFGYYFIEEWMRNKICNGVDLSICATGYIVFLHLTRPSRANHNFPFHIRTTQIAAMRDIDDPNFPHTEGFSKLRQADGGPLETSLSEINKIPDRTDVENREVSSAWFQGMT